MNEDVVTTNGEEVIPPIRELLAKHHAILLEVEDLLDSTLASIRRGGLTDRPGDLDEPHTVQSYLSAAMDLVMAIHSKSMELKRII